MVRISHELGFIWIVNGKEFTDKEKAYRHYRLLVRREDAINRRREAKIGRVRGAVDTDDCDKSSILGAA